MSRRIVLNTLLTGLLVVPVWAWGVAPAHGQPTHTYYVYVCAESDDEVALVSFGPEGVELVKSIPVGIFPAETEGPHGIDVSPDGKHWYVSIAHGLPFGTVHKYETGSDDWVADVTLDMYPATLDISAATGLLYVVNFNLHGPLEPSSISVVETETMIEVARVPTGIRPHGSRLNVEGTRHYSVSVMSDELVELDALSFEISRRLRFSELADPPNAGAVVQPTWVTPPTPQGRVYVAGNNADAIFEIDLERWTIRRTFSAGPGPYNLDLTPDGETLVVTYKKGAAVGFWDLESGRESARVDTTRTIPHGVVVTPDGRYAFVTLEGTGGEPGTVEIYDVEARQRVGVVDVGKQAGGVAFWKMEP